MRFVLNKFPDDKDFNPDENWTLVKESSSLWIILLQAVPFMIVNVFIVVLLMRLIGIDFAISVKTMFISILVFLPIHEFIHAIFFPERLKSKNVFFGFTFKGFSAYAAYIGEMKRNAYIKVSVAPFVIITFLGFLYLIVIGRNGLIEHIIIFNALASCADLLGVFHILRQVPKGAILRNKTIRTYWRIDKNAIRHAE
jgi:hypothetical protein